MKISATIITLNEEHNIADCLKSLDFVDEIVVVDSGSTDKTEEICKSFPKVRFIYQQWLGYGAQKNFAVSQATHLWILSVDADEIITTELKQEILDLCTKPPISNGYKIGRKNMYRGKWVKHSGWWPDEIIRLFRRDAGGFSDRLVHESVDVTGEVGSLSGTIEHKSFNAPEDFLDKARRYAVPGAIQMHKAGKRGSVILAVVKSSAAFIKSFVLKKGFLDGRVGILIAVSGAVGVFYRVMKLIELNEDE